MNTGSRSFCTILVAALFGISAAACEKAQPTTYGQEIATQVGDYATICAYMEGDFKDEVLRLEYQEVGSPPTASEFRRVSHGYGLVYCRSLISPLDKPKSIRIAHRAGLHRVCVIYKGTTPGIEERVVTMPLSQRNGYYELTLVSAAGYSSPAIAVKPRGYGDPVLLPPGL